MRSLLLTMFVATVAIADQRPAELPESVAAGMDNLSNRYWLYLPERYKDSTERMPLIVYLHGSSKRGTDLERIKENGIPPLLDTRPDWDFVVVSPQAGFKYRWQECWRPDDLKRLVKHLLATYQVDPKRVYLTGLIMGGYGTWACAAAYPELFAAAIPICGGGNPNEAAKYGKLPIWAFHGALDLVVLPKRSRQMVDAIRQAGGNAKLTIYPTAGHDSYTETYGNADVYAWLLKHQR